MKKSPNRVRLELRITLKMTMGFRRLAKKWLDRIFETEPSYISRSLAKHKLVLCNKDVSVYLAGFEVPYVIDYLSKQILLRAEIPLLFREPGRTSMRRQIGEHFLNTGTLPKEVIGDVHEACALYKRWLRTLRDPLLPLDIQRSIVERLSVLEEPEEWQLQRLTELIVDGESPPPLPLVCFLHCIFFLQQITRLKNRNLMTASSLAAIFARYLFRYEALELRWPHITDDSQDQRDYHAMQERVLLKVKDFLEFLISGRGNRVFAKALRRRADRQKDNGHIRVRTQPIAQAQPLGHHLPVIPTEARAALVQSSEPILLMWRSHDFDMVTVHEERSPLRMTFVREMRARTPNRDRDENSIYL